MTILYEENHIIMNKIILLGRLTKNPIIQNTTTGKSVTRFNLAVDRPFANQQGEKEVDFIPVSLWGKNGENLAKNVFKGQRVLIEGRLQIRSYDAKDGSKRWIAEVIAERFEFIEKKAETEMQTQYTENIDNYASQIPFNEEIDF